MRRELGCVSLLWVGLSLSLFGCEDAWARGRLTKPPGGGGEAVSDAGPRPDAPDVENAYGRYVLVALFDTDAVNAYIEPHDVRVLDAATGEELPGGPRAETAADSGVVRVPQLPAGVVASLHVVGREIGNDAPASSTIDSVLLSAPGGPGEMLIPLGNAGLSQIMAGTSAYEPLPERAALWGRVQWGPEDGLPVGPVGCATVTLQDESGPIHSDVDLRYVREPLPVPPSELDHTTVESGRFLLANMPLGAHRLRVSVDGGETFIGEASFVARRARRDAVGPEKDILYILDIHIVADKDPTPRRCR